MKHIWIDIKNCFNNYQMDIDTLWFSYFFIWVSSVFGYEIILAIFGHVGYLGYYSLGYFLAPILFALPWLIKTGGLRTDWLVACIFNVL